jgi:hypothetical protein
MASTNTKKTAVIGTVVLLAIVAAFVMFKTTAAARRNAQRNASMAKARTGVPTDPQAIVQAAEKSKILIFRNVRSWNRLQDFEEALAILHFKFDVKPSSAMESADLSTYDVVIIPGAQWKTGFYSQFAENAARFESYVSNGGTLVLELNGAEQEGITLPGGVTMVQHGAVDNQLLLPEHPILLPLGGVPIHAHFASHGYLAGVPKDAMILTTEMTNGTPLPDRPTFIEYPHGAGRIIAACQCFHSQDKSGRGPLMQTLLAYATVKQWFLPGKS